MIVDRSIDASNGGWETKSCQSSEPCGQPRPARMGLLDAKGIMKTQRTSGRTNKPSRLKIATIMAGSGVLIAGMAAGGFASAADHLDAPGLTSPSARPDADINDVYAFNSSTPGRSVIAVTTGPGAGAIAPLTYATGVDYRINIDQNGDAIEDLAYVIRFEAPRRRDGLPRQRFTVTKYGGTRERGDDKKDDNNNKDNTDNTDSNQGDAASVSNFRSDNSPSGGRGDGRDMRRGAVVANGWTNQPATSVKRDGLAWAGLRSDPFFFDLDAFRQVVLGQDRGRTGFCDQSGHGVDFFASLNTNAIVLDLPNTTLGGKIGVWAQTLRSSDGAPIDQMGRPAINTVFNKGEDKNKFNATPPSQQAPYFSKNVSDTLALFSSLDTEGAYSPGVLSALTSVLIPDVITFDTATPAAGPLNGRALGDDVIDAELNIVTGGFQVPGRNNVGAIPSDCVSAHSDISGSFPYLGAPHTS